MIFFNTVIKINVWAINSFNHFAAKMNYWESIEYTPDIDN